MRFCNAFVTETAGGVAYRTLCWSFAGFAVRGFGTRERVVIDLPFVRPE
jgi:hypothetical protein